MRTNMSSQNCSSSFFISVRINCSTPIRPGYLVTFARIWRRTTSHGQFLVPGSMGCETLPPWNGSCSGRSQGSCSKLWIDARWFLEFGHAWILHWYCCLYPLDFNQSSCKICIFDWHFCSYAMDWYESTCFARFVWFQASLLTWKHACFVTSTSRGVHLQRV